MRNSTLDIVLRIAVAVVLIVTTAASPAIAQDKPDDADIENIGNREINDGFWTWNLSSLEEEIAQGRGLAAEIERQVRLVDDPVVNEYVNRVGQNIVRNSDARVPFSFKVIEDDSVNAIALPGGFVFVNTGILLAADEEAELAGVLAHEIAHVAARHGTENATKGQIISLATIPLIFLGGVIGLGARSAANFAIPMGFMKFTRGAEEEADYLGIQYAYKSGYDPGAAVTFFEKIQAREAARPGTISSLFETHPPTTDRIEKTQRNIELVLPERDRYVLTTSEFMDVKEHLVAYLNRQPDPDEEEEYRPSLRRRVPRPDTGGTEGDDAAVYETEDGRPRLERRGEAAEGEDLEPEPAPDEPPRIERRPDDPDRMPDDDDRPILRRAGGDR